MAAKTDLLSAPECNNASSEGRAIRKLHDGGGLYLWVYADGGKFWRLRYRLGGKEKSLSFGAYPQISLKEARAKRDEQRKVLDANLAFPPNAMPPAFARSWLLKIHSRPWPASGMPSSCIPGYRIMPRT